MTKYTINLLQKAIFNTRYALLQVLLLPLLLTSSHALATVELADKPLLTVDQKGNVALALSVEWPTGVLSSYKDSYDIINTYIGYFDPEKCYSYETNGAGTDDDYFEPQALSTGHSCQTVKNGRWSGNYLNWATSPAIDSFRSVLTGGYRHIDTEALTVLEKANSGNFPEYATPNKTINSVPLAKKSTPYKKGNLTIRTYGLNGSTFQIFSSDSGKPLNETFYTRVRVCKPTLLEANCTSYPSGYDKPTGLIQKNAKKLDFAAFGYLLDSSSTRDGGVLRARMSSISPDGDYPEWSATTGQFYTNPHTNDAIASNVTNSGVINYLNQFGLKNGYKSLDPVSELYYTVGRYFRNKNSVPSYSNNLTDEMKDGFPVIDDWSNDDPISNACEANYIIGVGDTNTWYDSNLPRATAAVRNYEPSKPQAIIDDEGDVTNTTEHLTDVTTSTNYIGNLQGIGNIGNSNKPWCCPGSSFFMAGLAYDLHTRDFRLDMAGKQTITTYWLDTLEVGDQQGTGGNPNMRNQFWLTAKYGGFDVPDNYDPYNPGNHDPAKSTWDENNDNDPDNYFRANKPELMIAGLTDTFSSIVGDLEATTTGFSLSSPQILSTNYAYSAGYNTKNWTGSVSGSTIGFDSNGNPDLTEAWSTNTTFPSQVSGEGWDTGRYIATANCVASGTSGEQNCTGTPFRYGNLNGDSQSALSNVGTLPNVGADALNFLRGDRSQEGTFRTRTKMLGDIVHSQVRPVGAPNASYSEATNAGYGTFKTNHQNRPTVVYVGANDGMLHAFDGITGSELFAYVPNALFKGPTNTPSENGLTALANNDYVHRYYVDSTPVAYDIQFSNDSWHTLLIGGLGKGGKSYYALDVTDPSAISNETVLASKVKWEFTHKDLGYSYGRPVVVKADNDKWVVILTSGYNNADGQGYFFILDAETGALLNKVSTGVGNLSSEAGMAHASAFIKDARDFIADAAYAGDLQGNVWRLDLTGIAATGYGLSPTRIATLKSSGNIVQPITTSPVIEYDQIAQKRIIFVGTGKLLSEIDLSNTTPQSFYGIYDGSAKAFDTSGAFPIIPRAVMVNHTNVLGSFTTDTNKPFGYYIDFESGYQMNAQMSSAAGTIAFGTQKIQGSSCEISTKFRGYALNYASGESLLVNNDGSAISTQYFEGDGVVSSVQIYNKPNSNNASVNFSTSDNGLNTSVEIQATSPGFRLLNWRAIPNEN